MITPQGKTENGSPDSEQLAVDLLRANNNIPLCSVGEAAKLIRYRKYTVYAAIKDGSLKAIRLSGKNGTLTIRVRELARWLLSRESK